MYSPRNSFPSMEIEKKNFEMYRCSFNVLKSIHFPTSHHNSALFLIRVSQRFLANFPFTENVLCSLWVNTVKIIESNRMFRDQLNKAELSNQAKVKHLPKVMSKKKVEEKNGYCGILWTWQLFSLPLFTLKTHQCLSETHRPYRFIAKRKSTN